MEVLNRAYNGLRGFVDEFANSTTGSDTAPRKMENRKAWYAEWDDNYMGDLLNNYLTKSILRKIADSYYGKQLDELLEEATELTALVLDTIEVPLKRWCRCSEFNADRAGYLCCKDERYQCAQS